MIVFFKIAAFNQVSFFRRQHAKLFFSIKAQYLKIIIGVSLKLRQIPTLPKIFDSSCFARALFNKRQLEFFEIKLDFPCTQIQICQSFSKKNFLVTFFFFSVGQKVIYKKVREALGFDRCVTFMTGAAPIAKEVVHYFLSLDIQILELYGMNLDLLFLFNIYFYYHLSTYNAFMSRVKI